MSLSFVIPEFNIGGAGTPPLQFFKRGFNLNGSSGGGGWTDIILHGNTALTLVNAKENGLNYVKLFGNAEQRNLPKGYTELDSITMESGACAIGLTQPTANGRVELDFTTTTLDSATKNLYGGRYISAPTGAGIRLTHNSNKEIIAYCFDTNSTSTGNYKFQNNTRYKYIYDNGTLTLISGGSTVYTQNFTINDTTTSDVVINGYKQHTGAIIPNSEVIIVNSYKVYNAQGVLVENWKPALKGTTVCFYDTVSGTDILPTEGTFTAGTVAVPTPDYPIDIISNNGALKVRHQSGLPLGYKLVDYIKANAMIELDKPTNDTMELVTRFYREGTNAQYIYQSDTSSGGITNTTAYISSGGNWRFGRRTASINVDAGTMITSVQNAEGVWINGEQVGTYEGVTAFTSTNNLKLFGTQSSPTLRLYWLKVYQSGAPFYDLVPCQRESDLSYGVYDFVSGQFFTNTDETITMGSFVSDPVVAKGAGQIETVVDTGYFGNLIDLNALTSGYYYNTSGVYTTASNVYLTDWIKVYNGDTITVYFKKTPNANAPVVRMNIFDAQKNWVSQSTMTLNDQDEDVTVLNIVADGYIRISGASNLLDWDTTQIIRGNYTVETMPAYKAYVPYHTATAEDLLKIDDYQDVQSVLDGEVTRNVGVKVLDGTETWVRQDASGSIPFATFNLTLSTTAVGGISNVPRCSHFRSATSTGRSNIPDNGVGVTQNSTYTSMWFRCDSITTINDFTAWLAQQYNAGTPVIVIYPLATATTETVTGQPLTIQAGTNIVEITQASIDNLELEVSYKGKEGE